MESYRQNTEWLNEYGNSLQGNILQFHGRNFSRLLFFQLKNAKLTETREYLFNLAKHEVITSAAKQKSQRDEWKRIGGNGELFLNIYLTPLGYQYFDETFPDKELPADMAAHRSAAFNQTVHCVILLAHDSKGELDNYEAYYIKQFIKVLKAKKVAAEAGNKLFKSITLPDGRNRNFPMDHFGFVDGISDLLFTKEQVKKLLQGFCNDRNRPLPKAQIKNIILEHHVGDIRRFILHPEDSRKMGSFGVFMKLEQHVREFNKQEAQFKKQLIAAGADEYAEECAAHMIGRTREGTPLADPSKNAVHTWNEFYYDGEKGAACPFHMHTRKMNPRTNRQAGTDIAILRRSMPYGPVYDPQITGPQKKRGLLFLSFQNSIQTFETQLKKADHSEEHPGVDPLIGLLQDRYFNKEERAGSFIHTFPAITGKDEKPFTFKGFGSFVKLEARLDVFAPSMDFFKSL